MKQHLPGVPSKRVSTHERGKHNISPRSDSHNPKIIDQLRRGEFVDGVNRRNRIGLVNL
ncbi:MAG: hypothetical protein PHI85_04920 [Victivallaceae bacterium]|nr:hypothetical protein [Victivallaceae bacterium]